MALVSISYPILATLWFFLLGTAIGSFLNVVILRHESDEKLTGRSHCPTCKRTLSWHELVPIVSYLIQKGKCRGCSERISPQYPFVEFATGILFALVFLVNVASGSTPYTLEPTTFAQLILELCVWSLLIVITVYDIRTKLIPDIFSYSFAALAFIGIFFDFSFSLLDFVAGPLLFLPFWALWRFSDGKWMGLGDGKLALGIGWLLGLEGGASAIMLSFWYGAAISLALIAVQRITAFLYRRQHPFLSLFKRSTSQELSLKSEVPFGPFMVLGTLTVYLGLFSLRLLIG